MLVCSTVSMAAPSPSKASKEAGEVRTIIDKVNTKWQSSHAPQATSFWHVAAYHTGNMEAYKLTGNKEYLDYSVAWAEHNDW
ncbi:MAG: glycoside hydrolase family 88 protein, partial [Muribaculaceae bacterium]|nr:glycoside hydrolase family 88 protein [Muribaculaceae bacterium]